MAILERDSVPAEVIRERIRQLVAQREPVLAQMAAYNAAIGELEALINDGTNSNEPGDGAGSNTAAVTTGGDGTRAPVTGNE